MMEKGCDVGGSCNQIDVLRRASSTSPTTNNAAESHNIISASRSSSFSKPFRGLKRILFGSKTSEKSAEKSSSNSSNMEPSRPPLQGQQPHASRSRRHGEVSSSDDEGVILSESCNSADVGGSMEGVESSSSSDHPQQQGNHHQPGQRVMAGAGSGPIFLPAFPRHGRTRNDPNANSNSTSNSDGCNNNINNSSGGAVGGNSNPSWSKVRHSSSHRSLSSQSSEKEEGYASSRASHGSRESIDLDSLVRNTGGGSGDQSPMAFFPQSSNYGNNGTSSSSSSSLLPSEAMKHRIAVRPKRRHAVGSSGGIPASNGITSGGQILADLPSLKEEPGYLSNAAYTPAPFVVNQQSIGQQLGPRKVPLSMNQAASNGATGAPTPSSAQPLSSSSAVATAPAPKVMKQTTSSTPAGSSSPPMMMLMMDISSIPATVVGPKPSVVQRGIKLPGLEPTMLLGGGSGSTSLSHSKSSLITRPGSSQASNSNSSSNNATNSSQQATATPSPAVAPASTTDDELAKVFSRLRKVNPDAEKNAENNSSSNNNSSSGVDSSSLNLPVVLRKTGHILLPDSTANTGEVEMTAASSNSGSTGDNNTSNNQSRPFFPGSKPQTLPKPPTSAKNRQTVCLASLPFPTGPEVDHQHVPVPLQQSVASVKLAATPTQTTSPSTSTTTPSFPKSTSLNFTSSSNAGLASSTSSSNNNSRPPWMKAPSPSADHPPPHATQVQTSRLVFQLNQHQQPSNV